MKKFRVPYYRHLNYQYIGGEKLNIKIILEYLSDLENHNEREWYHANKEQYKKANQEFEGLIQALIFEIGRTDSTILHNMPKDLTFKLVRDTRFSADKSPYNPTFRAHIASRGKLPVPVGYFIAIKPNGRSFLGGGLFTDMFKEATAMIRDFLVENGEEWESIIKNPTFTKYFSVKGEALKNVPNGYDKGHPQAEYLKNKSWYLEYPLTDGQITDDKFILQAAEIFEAMQPFNAFLNRALEKFEMPKRP
jgi:TIGR02453 family protein